MAEPIATGNSFTTPAISTTTSYVDATNGSCPTVPEVIATINPVNYYFNYPKFSL
jgi:hypothetical protein